MSSPRIDLHRHPYHGPKYSFHSNAMAGSMPNWNSPAACGRSFPTPQHESQDFMSGARRVNSHESEEENDFSSIHLTTSETDWSPLKEKFDTNCDGKKEMKKKVLIRSPPIKKRRRVVDSWTDKDNREQESLDMDLVSSSPLGNVFRSPSADKIRRRIGSVCRHYS